jgi:hypothetical protein
MTNGSQSAGPTAAVAAIASNDSTGSGQNSQELDQDEELDLQEESDTEQVTKSFGVMKVDNKTSYYISDVHWASVLNDIAEVRQFFASHKNQWEEQAEKVKASRKDAPVSSLVFGAMKPCSRAEIMKSFPSHNTTDLLIARYFSYCDQTSSILHVPTFNKQYNEYWKDPEKTSIVWIGMVFAMMRLATLSYHHDGDEPPEFRGGRCADLAGTYRDSMAQCLILADYTKPHKYLIETLIFHLFGDFSQTKDTDVSVWVLAGMTARLAMRMGYHRDSKMFLNITPFQGEMRRRLWTLVRQADVLFSFQVGLPSMLRSGDTDTDLPRNLYDEDFDEDSKELPPPRPNDEPTKISFLIAKSRLAFAFARVVEHTATLHTSSPYEEVMDIDNDLQRARDLIPERLCVRPTEDSHSDPISTILSRFHIISVYHKAQCVLHRRYLARARENLRFTPSRRTCIDSSMELLRFQSIFHRDIRPKNQMHKREQMNSLNSNDFLLAATIVCLDLYHGLQLQAAGRQSGDIHTWGRERREEMLAAIRGSYEIWNELRDESLEAYKVSGVLGVMLGKLTFVPQGTENGTVPPIFEPQDEKQSAAMTLGLLSSGMSPLNTGPSAFVDSPFKMADSPLSQGGFGTMAELHEAPSPFNILGQMPDMQPSNLDWEAWDNYLQNSTFDTSNQLWPMLDMQQQSQITTPLQQTMLPNSRSGAPDPVRLGSRLPIGRFPTALPDSSINFNITNGLYMNVNGNRSSNQQSEASRTSSGM